ncbi:MAG TPA: VOC family protein [Rhodanobacteraceae bacterium]|nr:VOC family protein [Rhodanobacteraceae bacterium]
MKTNPVCWFELYVQDMARARAFYESVLRTRFSRLESPSGLDMLAFPRTVEGAGAPGALVRMEGVESGGSGTLVYFECEDCAIELGRVEAAGGKIERGKTSLGPHGFMALALDTEGNRFGLYSMR